MHSLSPTMYGAIGILSICSCLNLCPALASAQMAQQDTQLGTSMSGPTSGEGCQSETGTITDRSVQQFSPRAGMEMEGQPGMALAPGAAGFKCSAHTGRM